MNINKEMHCSPAQELVASRSSPMAFQAMVEAARVKVSGSGRGPEVNDIETLAKLRKDHLSQPQQKVSKLSRACVV